tara:strand:+ start:2554 stop:2826 length:273 start_codon:yes stop_codon:yes gene_type:complete
MAKEFESVGIYQSRHLEDLAVLFARLGGAMDQLYPELDLGNAVKEAVITHLEYTTVNDSFNDMRFRKRYAEEYLRYGKEVNSHGLSILRT